MACTSSVKSGSASATSSTLVNGGLGGGGGGSAGDSGTVKKASAGAAGANASAAQHAAASAAAAPARARRIVMDQYPKHTWRPPCGATQARAPRAPQTEGSRFFRAWTGAASGFPLEQLIMLAQRRRRSGQCREEHFEACMSECGLRCVHWTAPKAEGGTVPCCTSTVDSSSSRVRALRDLESSTLEPLKGFVPPRRRGSLVMAASCASVLETT